MDPETRARVRAHRSQQDGVTFVGITGSCGKTTTKDLTIGLLSTRFAVMSNPGSGNCGRELVENILRVRADPRFVVQELGAWGPGTLDMGLDLLRPDLGVVLNVRHDHYGQFHGLQHTASEKGKLIECVGESGTVILNRDDPLVWDMRRRAYHAAGACAQTCATGPVTPPC